MRMLRGAREKAKRADVLRGFVALGRSAHRDIARRHDAHLYGKSGAAKKVPPKIRDRAASCRRHGASLAHLGRHHFLLTQIAEAAH